MPISLRLPESPLRPRQILLGQLPDNIEFDRIPSPVTSNSNDNNDNNNIRSVVVYKALSPNADIDVDDPQLLNHFMPNVKQLLNQENFNFTKFKARLWQEKMKICEAISYELALLIPDLVSTPFTDLGFPEHPHLGIYIWGVAGGLRTTIGRILQQQWLYSFVLSETGFDSDVGVLCALSQANHDLLIIGSDIGSATAKLKDWQRRLPAIIVNIIWDGREVRTIKGEGTIEVVNNGMAFYGGGNNPLGQSEFTVKDVSRIIQNQMPSTKLRNIELMEARFKGVTRLDQLVNPVILYTHYLNALIIQGRIRTGILNGKRIVLDIDEELRKKIAGLIFRNYVPQLTTNMPDDEIWNNMDEIKQSAVDLPEDVNAILRILTMAFMLVKDSVIDNILLRPYEIAGNEVHIRAIQEDLDPLCTIMDRQFWEMKRYEFKSAHLYKEVTPDYFTPVEYYHKLLVETRQILSATVLYDMAKERLIEGGKLNEELFNSIYGGGNRLSDNYKLQRAMRGLEHKQDVLKIDGHPIQYKLRNE
jgi:hypothetical protein